MIKCSEMIFEVFFCKKKRKIPDKIGRLIGIIFTLLIFIFNIYFDEIRKEFILSDTFAENTGSLFTIEDNQESANVFIGMTQMSATYGKQDDGKIISQSIVQKRDMKISLDFLYKKDFSLKEGRVYSNLYQLQSLQSPREKHITNYIHRSDGKKRI